MLIYEHYFAVVVIYGMLLLIYNRFCENLLWVMKYYSNPYCNLKYNKFLKRTNWPISTHKRYLIVILFCFVYCFQSCITNIPWLHRLQSPCEVCAKDCFLANGVKWEINHQGFSQLREGSIHISVNAQINEVYFQGSPICLYWIQRGYIPVSKKTFTFPCSLRYVLNWTPRWSFTIDCIKIELHRLFTTQMFPGHYLHPLQSASLQHTTESHTCDWSSVIKSTN